jgi:hypothetical protein
MRNKQNPTAYVFNQTSRYYASLIGIRNMNYKGRSHSNFSIKDRHKKAPFFEVIHQFVSVSPHNASCAVSEIDSKYIEFYFASAQTPIDHKP